MGSESIAAARRPRALPLWAVLGTGITLVATGLVLLTRPFASVSVLILALGAAFLVAAGAELVSGVGTRGARRVAQWGLAALLALGGIAILLLPGLTVRWVVVLTGAVLVAGGVREIVDGVLRASERLTRLLGGTASLLLGVLALAWRDVTVLAVGVLFGVWLLVTGVRLLLAAHRGRGGSARRRPHRRGRFELVAAVLALGVSLVLTVVGIRLTGAPVPDDFTVPPASVPAEPGALLRAEPFTRTVPDGSSAWRILYTTTRSDGVPAVASGLVVVPDGAVSAPTVAWAHGTTGAAVGCAPSLLPEPFTAGAMPDLAAVLARGWAVVATDYVGLGTDAPHPYLVGEAAARSVLDAVRASRALPDSSLGEQVVVWGHSQGGAAALWTGGLAPEYAPELDVAGVAAMAPAADLSALIGVLASGKAGTFVGPLVLTGFAAEYPEIRVEDYVIPEARLLVEETAKRCWADPDAIVSLLQAGVIDRPIWSRDPAQGALGARIEQNVPRLPIPAPLLLAQGDADPLVLPDAQTAYVSSLCAAGQAVDYRRYAGLDHMGIVTGDSPLLAELMTWTSDRLAGTPPTSSC